MNNYRNISKLEVDIIKTLRATGFSIIIWNDTDVDNICKFEVSVSGTKNIKSVFINTEIDDKMLRTGLAYELAKYMYAAQSDSDIYISTFRSDTDVDTQVMKYAIDILLPGNKFISRFMELHNTVRGLSDILKTISDDFKVEYRFVEHKMQEIQNAILMQS